MSNRFTHGRLGVRVTYSLRNFLFISYKNLFRFFFFRFSFKGPVFNYTKSHIFKQAQSDRTITIIIIFMIKITRFINLLSRRLTLGSLLTAIASFLFAIALRQLFLYKFDILPVKDEIQAIDISFLGIIFSFRFICNVFIEYLLNDKFGTPLIQE